jgi:hypothetical protein
VPGAKPIHRNSSITGRSGSGAISPRTHTRAPLETVLSIVRCAPLVGEVRPLRLYPA